MTTASDDDYPSIDISQLSSADDLPDNYIHEGVLTKKRFSVDVWFLKIDISADINIPQLDIVASVMSITIADLHLNSENPTGKIGGAVLGFKALATVTFDIGEMKLTVSADLCAPTVGCKQYTQEFKF